MPFQNLRISFFVLAFITTIHATEAYSQEKVLEVSEELKYEVSYGFIKLGYVKFVLTNSRREGKKFIYHSKLEVKSYPEVPFIKINEILESEMETVDDELFSKKFYETNFKDKSITRTDCNFNYTKNYIKFKVETDGNVEKNIQTQIKKNIRYRDELRGSTIRELILLQTKILTFLYSSTARNLPSGIHSMSIRPLSRLKNLIMIYRQ